MAEKIAEAVFPRVIETLWSSVEACLGVDETHSNFKEKITTLRAARGDLKDRTRKYKSKFKRTMDDWFDKVKVIETEAQKLESLYSAIRGSSLLRVFRGNKLSKKMTEMCSEIDEVVRKGYELGDTLVYRVAERVLEVTAPDISYILSLQSVLDKILHHLLNGDHRAIRILGMSGAGKTTILKNLNNHKTVARIYDRVVWVAVSGEENNMENLCTEMLQHEIVERLQVDTDGATDIVGVARKIKEELESVKYLLLLDDVKAELDLDMIGIPEGAIGSKIVMTTKLRHVQLPSCYNIEVKKLSPHDSWEMFHKLLALPNDVKDKPQLERTARKALDICDGLPLMIIMAARVFKAIEKREFSEISWSDALQTFRSWPEKGDNDMMKKMLKFCCDHLDSKQMLCFLYSALHPEDTEISTEGLFDCWEAENFLKSGNDAKLVGRNILRHLKNVILLEEGATGQFVTMHKVIRAIALNILSEEREGRCLVKTSQPLQKSNVPKRQRVDLWTDKEWISLANDSLDLSHDDPCSSQLTTLFVQKYSRHKKIPDSFFQHMHSLLVLSLYMTEIKTLPSSICKLSNLTVLNLNGCSALKELPDTIGTLRCLRVIDIRGSGVNKLPDQIALLTQLRRLLVSFTMSTQDNYDMIFKLSGLEELIIDVHSEEHGWCNKLIEDLVGKVSKLLRNLITFQFRLHDRVVDVIQVVDDTLKIYAPKEQHLTSFLDGWLVLEAHSFQIYIGCFISHAIEIPEFYLYDKYVKYYNGRGQNDVINKILTKAHAFELINHNDIEHLSSNVIESMDYVQGCFIQSCNRMSTILRVDDTQDRSLLPNMERMYVKNMPRLENFWVGRVPLGSLSKLKTLVLRNCQMLTVVFSNVIVQRLQELQYLDIQDCGGVKWIVTCSEDVGPYVFPKLTNLILCNMPSLRRICSTLRHTSLEKLKIHDCPTLKKLPLDGNSAMNLRSIEVERTWWEALQWADSEVKEQLDSRCFFR